MRQMLVFLHSAISGLYHLHFSFQGKSSVAHRDINSRNILVKENGECCISDLGHAMLDTGILEKVTIVGTKRYMAPEILDNSININPSFHALHQSDIYSFGLVMWETIRRTAVSKG